jgi:hypothetical protein
VAGGSTDGGMGDGSSLVGAGWREELGGIIGEGIGGALVGPWWGLGSWLVLGALVGPWWEKIGGGIGGGIGHWGKYWWVASAGAAF